MTEQEIIDRLVAVFKNREQFITGKVLSVNGNSCVVMPTNGDEELSGVRLSLVEYPDYLLEPAEGSIVMVGIDRVNKLQKKYFIVFCNSYKNYRMVSAGAEDVYSLTKTEKLISELNKTNAVLNAVCDTIKGWTVAPGDGGAALKTAMITALTGKSVGDYTDIKNENFKHG